MSFTERRTALMFTGQGSIQKPGMWERFRESPAALRIFKLADEVVGSYLSKLVAEGPMEELIQTKNAQPAIIAFDLAALAATKEMNPDLFGVPVKACLGHSAGEIAALTAAGVIDEATGLFLSYKRGLIMQEYGAEGTMAALLTDKETVQMICDRVNRKAAGEADKIEAVNFNGPKQTVISGPENKVIKAADLAEEDDILNAILQVPNPFHHSVLMKAAEGEFAKVIAETAFKDGSIPVILNVTGQPETSGIKIKEILSKQIASPVQWHESVLYLLRKEGITRFVEFGPRNILIKLLEGIDPQAEGYCISDYDSVKKLTSSLI